MSLPEHTRAVVTGAASGLGRALAVELAARGGRVLVADVDEVGGAETVRMVKDAGAQASFIRCDVRDPAQVAALLDAADERLGGVDLVANNAGVAVSGKVGEIGLEDWRWIVDINQWGVIYGCHTFVPRFVAQGRGYILNVASAAGLLSAPQMAPYNVTKAAVVALSETLHAELSGTGVRVSVLCPTFFKTNIIHAARSPAEHSGLVVKLMERSKVQAPDVAREALDAVAEGRLYVVPMTDGRMMWRIKRAAPEAFVRLAAWVDKRRAFIGD
jgi:NAD(P)-dependent dehydrogenase (short-subunit alcohol dehydrogenase family)